MKIKDLNWQGRLTIAYYLILFAVFPLYVHDRYFDIMDAKYRFYWILGLAFILLSLPAIWLDGKKDQNGELPGNEKKKIEKKQKAEKKQRTTGKRRRPLYVWMLLLFWAVSVISTLTSDYVYESFWGNEGRYTGLFLMTIYIFTTLIIAWKGTVLKPLLDLFLVVSFAVCLFGITDFFRMDIFGWHIGGDRKAVDIFYSTLGNVNTYTAYLGLVLGVSSGLYAAERRPVRAVLYYVLITVAFVSLITGQSDNAYLSIGVVLAFLPLYLLRTRLGTAKYVSLLASFALSAVFVVWMSAAYEGICIRLKGMYTILEKVTFLPVLAAVLFFISLALFWWAHRTGPEEPPARKAVEIWTGILIAGAACMIAVLIDANLLGNADRYGPFASYLHFTNTWGTDRGYGWRLGWEEYRKLPFIHQLFGHGPDTYGILVYNHRKESMEVYGYIFDTAHNEYLQYLTTLGPFGLLSYVLMQADAFRSMIRKIKEKPWILAPLLACLCYAAQSVVNISIPIATPIMWGLLAFGMAAARDAREAEDSPQSAEKTEENHLTGEENDS